MSKEKKQYKLHSIKMDLSISDMLEKFCQESGMTKTAVIEHGIKLYINSNQAIKEKLQKLDEYEQRMNLLLQKASDATKGVETNED